MTTACRVRFRHGFEHYRNHDQRTRILDAQDDEREATWRERALSAEDALKAAHNEILAQRTRIGELLGQVRDLQSEWTQEAIQRITTENTTGPLKRSSKPHGRTSGSTISASPTSKYSSPRRNSLRQHNPRRQLIKACSPYGEQGFLIPTRWLMTGLDDNRDGSRRPGLGTRPSSAQMFLSPLAAPLLVPSR
jgi:hypothetical protein